MWARWVAFALWAVVAAGAVGWGFKLFVQAPAAPADTRVADVAQAARGEYTRVLGVDPPPPAASAAQPLAPAADARFQLVGVVAPRPTALMKAAREGVAVIAVDGRLPKAFRVGARVEDGIVLQRVRARGVELGPSGGAATVALELTPPPAAATGQLPAAGAAAAAGGVPPPPPRAGQQRSVQLPGAAQPVPPPAGVQAPIPVPPPNMQPQFAPGSELPGQPAGVMPRDGLPRS